MTRGLPTSVVTSGLCLLLVSALPGGCASEENALDASNGADASQAGSSITHNGGQAGKSAGFGGTASAGQAGSAGSNGQAGSAAQGGAGGGSSPVAAGGEAAVDQCQSDADCQQVAGSCFLCVTAG